jgi:hypothetical protein
MEEVEATSVTHVIRADVAVRASTMGPEMIRGCAAAPQTHTNTPKAVRKGKPTHM